MKQVSASPKPLTVPLAPMFRVIPPWSSDAEKVPRSSPPVTWLLDRVRWAVAGFGLRQSVAGWFDTRAAQGWQAEYAALTLSGFPLRHRLDLRDPVLEAVGLDALHIPGNVQPLDGERNSGIIPPVLEHGAGDRFQPSRRASRRALMEGNVPKPLRINVGHRGVVPEAGKLLPEIKIIFGRKCII